MATLKCKNNRDFGKKMSDAETAINITILQQLDNFKPLFGNRFESYTRYESIKSIQVVPYVHTSSFAIKKTGLILPTN